MNLQIFDEYFRTGLSMKPKLAWNLKSSCLSFKKKKELQVWITMSGSFNKILKQGNDLYFPIRYMKLFFSNGIKNAPSE